MNRKMDLQTGKASGYFEAYPVKCTVVSQPGHLTPLAPESQGAEKDI